MALSVKDGGGVLQNLPTSSTGVPVHAMEVAGAALSSGNPMPCSDPSNAAFQGVVPITPGTPVTAGRSLGFVCTASGPVTLTMADGSTLTIPLVASASFQTLPLAVTKLTLGTGAAGTFWGLN